jgi:Zn-finger nucleic acid-binding protein
MICPKCISPMMPVEFGGIEIHRCTDCEGLWFDEFAKAELLTRKGAEKLDTGSAEIGKTWNQIDRILCPRCSTVMLRMVDLKQPHIWFEHCKVCGGSFFDAGEFRDLLHHTVLDFFRDLRVHARR